MSAPWSAVPLAAGRPAPGATGSCPPLCPIVRLTTCRLSTYYGRMAEPPMREPTFYVLAALLRGPLHGYAIMKRAGELSGGRVRLATGTRYTALDRLTAGVHLQLVTDESVGVR